MKTMRRFTMLTLLAATLTSSAYTQEPEDSSVYNGGDTTAYEDSSSATRWSAYVPVVALIAAAIFLSRAGTSGQRHSGSCSHNESCDYYSYYPYFGSGSYSSSYSNSYSGYSSNSGSSTSFCSH